MFMGFLVSYLLLLLNCQFQEGRALLILATCIPDLPQCLIKIQSDTVTLENSSSVTYKVKHTLIIQTKQKLMFIQISINECL